MNEQDRTKNGEGEASHVAETSQAIMLAATVAMLGVSLGVDVPQLLAASPSEVVPSYQYKIDGSQTKLDAIQDKVIQDKANAVQRKLDASQSKYKTPSPMPVDPPRQMPTR